MHNGSTTSYSSWLKQFLMHRGMTQPDQRPLYAYQCTAAEYEDLLGLLKRSGTGPTGFGSRDERALFVLFGAEWYRREHVQAVGWSWDGIWHRLGFRLEQKAVEDAVEGGLVAYWKRPLHHYGSGHRNFLGSVFSEGGLPFKALQRDDSCFKRLLERVLTRHDQARLWGYETRALVEQQLEMIRLPKVFSEHVSVELMAGMADELVALVANYDLGSADDPVAHLDARNPRWRDQFPLPLDDETGNRLLNNLLSQATEESKKQKRQEGGWNCRFIWRDRCPDSLGTQISLPETICFQLDRTPSTTRFDLVITEGERPAFSLGPGYAHIQDNLNAWVKPRTREIFLRERKRPDLPLSVAAMVGGARIASIPLENSAVVPGEVPLGLEPADGNWQLCGQASFRSKNEELLLVLPEGCGVGDVEVVEGSPGIAAANPVLGLRAATVKGKAQLLVIGEETYRIRTGHGGGNPELELSGKIFDWPTWPTPAFVGLPQPRWKPGSAAPQRQDCALYIGGRSAEQMPLSEVLGTRYVTVRNRDGDSLMRRKIGILPPGFRLELRSGNETGKGRITVYTRHDCLLEITTNGVHSQRIQHDDRVDLVLSADGLPPADVTLQVTPGPLGDPVRLILPYPGVGCLGFDAEGRTLPENLSVEDLLGCRLFLFGKPGGNTPFTLVLSPRRGSRRSIYYQWNYQVGDRPVEISIHSLREQILNLLSLDADIDQQIALSVQSSAMKEVRYLIHLHSTRLELDSAHNLISIADRARVHARELEPVLMLLPDPQQKPRKLVQRTSQGIAVGDFELPPEVDKNGPWLIVPATADSVSFRSYFLRGGIGNTSFERPLNSLQAAVRAFDPTREPNPFSEVFDAMADNPLHSGWEFLSHLFRHFGHLPMASFEAWKALVIHPRALAVSLFKFEMDPDYLGELEASFPILWEFMPLKHFQDAVTTFRSFLAENGIAQVAIEALLDRRLGQLGNIVPGFSGELKNFLAGKPLGQEQHLPAGTIQDIAQKVWYQALIRDRSDAHWPEQPGARLQQWHRQQEKKTIRIDPTMSHHNAVVYLPMFAAAVASGDAHFTDIFSEHDAESVFSIRQIRDFDATWFHSMYQYCLLRRATAA